MKTKRIDTAEEICWALRFSELQTAYGNLSVGPLPAIATRSPALLVNLAANKGLPEGRQRILGIEPMIEGVTLNFVSLSGGEYLCGVGVRLASARNKQERWKGISDEQRQQVQLQIDGMLAAASQVNAPLYDLSGDQQDKNDIHVWIGTPPGMTEDAMRRLPTETRKLAETKILALLRHPAAQKSGGAFRYFAPVTPSFS